MSQVAGRIIKVHIFATGIAAVNSTGVWCSVPFVDSSIELHARICAFPSSFCYLSEELFGFDGLDCFAGAHGL